MTEIQEVLRKIATLIDVALILEVQAKLATLRADHEALNAEVIAMRAEIRRLEWSLAVSIKGGDIDANVEKVH
jgi:hypothetical protein